MDGASFAEEFAPDAVCSRGGIYQVTHREHRQRHNVVVRKGEHFPRCHKCGDAVRFRLIKPADEPPKTSRTRRARKKSAGH
jgi:hypothetical protein